MDNSTQHPQNNRIYIETDELILTVNLDQIHFVRLINNQTIQISGQNFNYSVPFKNQNIISEVQNLGFIRIQKYFYINPHQISEYNIKTQELKFANGEKTFISNSKTLLHFFVENPTDINKQ